MYRILYRLLASPARLAVRSGRSKDLEIIVLRHQLASTLDPDKLASVARAVANLDVKLLDQDFESDVEKLVAEWPAGYTVQAAGQVARAVPRRPPMTLRPACVSICGTSRAAIRAWGGARPMSWRTARAW